MGRGLVIKVTCGVQEPERLNQAFTVAVAAIASGAQVSLWLTGEASWLGLPGRAEEFTLPLATPLAQMRDAIAAAGTLTICTQCAGRREITEDDLVPGARIAGAAVFAEEALRDGVQALVY
jgi:predicted peroxiredoxin